MEKIREGIKGALYKARDFLKDGWKKFRKTVGLD